MRRLCVLVLALLLAPPAAGQGEPRWPNAWGPPPAAAGFQSLDAFAAWCDRQGALPRDLYWRCDRATKQYREQQRAIQQQEEAGRAQQRREAAAERERLQGEERLAREAQQRQIEAEAQRRRQQQQAATAAEYERELRAAFWAPITHIHPLLAAVLGCIYGVVAVFGYRNVRRRDDDLQLDAIYGPVAILSAVAGAGYVIVAQIAFSFSVGLGSAIAGLGAVIAAVLGGPGVVWGLIVILYRGLIALIHGYYYLFVRHPAEAVVVPALESGRPIDVARAGHALTPDPSEFTNHPPAYQSQHLANRGEALQKKLDTDTAIAQAIERRERARAALADAEAQVREAKGKPEGSRS